MINSKVMLTYKRKRKFSVHESVHGIGCRNSCSNYSSDKLSTVHGNLVESSETYLQDSQNGDARPCENCVSFDAVGNLLRCHSCSDTFHPQCVDPPLKHIPHWQWLCSTCVEQQDSSKSMQQQVQASRRVNSRKTVEESELGRSICSSLKMLQTVRPDEATPMETEESVQTDESPEKKSDCLSMGLSSYMNPVPDCKSPLTDESSILQSTIDAPKKSSSECLGASIERDCTIECTSASTLKASDLDTADSPLKDNTDVVNVDGCQKNKFNTPVITFTRREKNKKNVNETGAQNQLIKGKEHSVAKCCNTAACSLGCSYEDASQRCSSATQLSALILLKDDKLVEHNKKEDVNSTSSIVAGGFHETKMHVERDQSTQGCVQENELPIVARVPCLNSHLHLSSWHPEFHPGAQVQPKECTGTSSTNETDLEVIRGDKQLKFPKVEDFNVAQSQTILSDGVKETVKPGHVSKDGTVLANLDLTLTPPDSPSTEENTANEEELSCQKPLIDSRAEILLDSPNSVEPNHVTVLREEVPQRGNIGGLLETTDDTIINKISSRREFTMLSMGNLSEDLYKQSCTDEEISKMVPLPSISPDATASIGLEGRVFISRSECEKNPYNKMAIESPLSPCSIGLPLPSKPAINFFKDSPSMPSLSNFGFASRGHIPEMPFQSEKTSYLRHKQILDNIIARAGALRESWGCSLGQLKGSTRTWSEEELDFLWVGVRRHGKGNWNTILRDPRLCFSEFRDAADLAERWGFEQSKLLDTTNYPSLNSGFLSRNEVIGTRSNSNYCSERRSTIGSQTLIDETRLSLGDVYVQRDLNMFDVPAPFTVPQTLTKNGIPERLGSIGNSELTNSVLQRIGTKQLQTPSRRQRNQSPSYSKYRLPRYDPGMSVLPQNPIERLTIHDGLGAGWGLLNSRSDDSLLRDNIPSGLLAKGTNLPHWLREVVKESPSSPLESVLVPNVGSASAESMNLHPYNYHRFIPMHSNIDTSLVSSIDPHQKLDKNSLKVPSDIPTPVHSNLDLHSRLSSNSRRPPSGNLISNYRNTSELNRSCSYPVTRANELIVINSDASSEETISDDQGCRF